MNQRIVIIGVILIAVIGIAFYTSRRNKIQIGVAYAPPSVIAAAPTPTVIAPPKTPPTVIAPPPMVIAPPPMVIAPPRGKSLFDIYPPNSNLLATNINKWYGILANANPAAPGAIPGPLTPLNPTNLSKYFKLIWPNMPQLPDNQLLSMYVNLDCWYLDFIPQLAPKVSNDMYIKDRLPALTAIDNNSGIEYARLFDSTVCDCLRISYKTCVYSKDRLTAMALKSCPLWDGIRSNVTPQWLLNRAYNSDNTDTNFRPDKITRQGMSGKKGFPSYSYYEGIVYPGEYGITELCTTAVNVNPYWKEFQPGLKVNGKKLEMSNSTSPWFNESDCSAKDCQNDYFLDDSFSCVKVTSDGLYGPAGDYSRCLRDKTYTIENFNPPCCSIPVLENFSTDFSTDCKGGFPDNLCPEVNPKDYREFWTYPQIGCGLWYTVGKSVAVNTKLGFLLAPESENGCNLDFNRLLEIRGSSNAFEQNLVQQVNRVSAIIKNGSVSATNNWPAMTLADLQKHGYTGSQVNDGANAQKAAMDLVKFWYMEGYTGLDKGIPNGFNYNYSKYFPLGAHFSYASRFDNIVLGMMTIKGLDSLQLLLEPQNSVVGLRPAYMFEVLSKKPTSKAGLEGSAFQDTTTLQCKATYSLDPSSYIANYMKYGYLPKSVVPLTPPLLNPITFKAKMDSKSFKPV